MKLVLDSYRAICGTRIFKINGMKATYKDFGEKYDTSADNAKPYCCGNMIFEPRRSTQKVLDKYGITADEYARVCDQLRKQLSFGLCRLCQ